MSREKLKPWLGLTSLIGSQLIILLGIAIWLWFFPSVGNFVATPSGAISISIISGLSALAATIIFSRTFSIFSIVDIFELRALRQGINVTTPVVEILLGGIGILVVRCHLGGDVESSSMARYFVHEVGATKYLFAALLLIGPIVEEIVMRGFLYRAFRHSYSVMFSISVVVLVGMTIHWNLISASIWVFFLLAGLQIALCVLLERTHNLWECIACHIAYNATLIVAH